MRVLLASLAAAAAALVLAVPAGAARPLPPGASYPWVQPPAWVTAAWSGPHVFVPPTYPWMQPPAWIPIV